MNATKSSTVAVSASSIVVVEAKDTKRLSSTKGKTLVQQAQEELTYCNLIGCRQVLLVLLIAAIETFQCVLVYLYSGNNTGDFFISDPVIAVFFILSALFCIQLFWAMSRVIPIAKALLKKYHDPTRQNTSGSCNVMLKHYYSNIGLNGKYYLWKMYGYEFLENVVQFYNSRQVFFCSMGFHSSLLICIVLTLETSLRAHRLGKILWSSKTNIISVNERDMQIITDIVVDLFFLIFPIAITYYVYEVTLLPGETLLIILMPSLSLFVKLRFMFIQSIARSVDSIIFSLQEERSFRLNRNRASFFAIDRETRIVRLQNKHFPRSAKICVFVISMLSFVFMLSIVVVQLVTVGQVNSKCSRLLGGSASDVWDKGCVAKTAFCKNRYFRHVSDF